MRKHKDRCHKCGGITTVFIIGACPDCWGGKNKYSTIQALRRKRHRRLPQRS